MNPLDPLTWSGMAQGFLVGALVVLAIQTVWRHRPTHDEWSRMRDDFEPIRHVWLVHPDEDEATVYDQEAG